MKMSRDVGKVVQSLLVFSTVVLNSQCNDILHPPDSMKEEYVGVFQLSIIHMNDFHGRFLEVNKNGWPCQRSIDKQCFGGLPRISTAVRSMKEDMPNSIFVNAGDYYQGTVWYNIHKWKATVEFLNMLPHDAMTIGNHEFDDDIQGLVPFLQHVNAPVVLTNVDTENEPSLQNLIKKSHVIEKRGRKIGILGVIFRTVSGRTRTGKLFFTNEIDAINKEAQNLKEQGVNIIIVLSHCGLKIDRRIAARCPDVDVIVGGHSHTFLHQGPVSAPYDKPIDEYPIVIKQPNTDRTVLIVQAFAFTKYLGVLLILLDDGGEIVDWSGGPILLDETFAEDEDMLKQLQPYKDIVDAKSAEVIGKSKIVLKDECHWNECAIGDMITDAMVASYVGEGTGYDWTYAAIAINYADAIKKPINAGPITRGDLMMVMPFSDTWDVIEVQGRDIRQALEDSFFSSFYRGRTNYRSRFVWSGMDVVYDTSKKNGKGVVEVNVRCQECEVFHISYKKLEDEKWYRIVVPAFIAEGGGAIKLAENHRNRRTGPADIDELSAFIKIMSPLNYRVDTRVHFCDRKVKKNCGKVYRKFIPRQKIFPDEYVMKI